ncbi:MAG: Holliday junction resolvase RuvX [Alphaproteobacteria bacterium]
MDLLENIVDQCPNDAVLLGLDVGKKTIGLAVGSVSQGIATPVCTIKRKKFSQDLKQLENVIGEYDVTGYVIGYPLHIDGGEGRKCQSIRDFTLEFERQLSIKPVDGKVWVALWDERFSTAVVEDFVDRSVDMSRRRAKEKGVIDKLAAQVILQGALDYISARAL